MRTSLVPDGVVKPRVVTVKLDVEPLGRAVALFRDIEDVGDDRTLLVLTALFVVLGGLVSMEQQDNVGVLLNRARFAQIMQRGLLLAFLGSAVELGEDDDRDVEFLGQ